MREYIEYNTTQRAAAQSEFEKEFYKLMNNRWVRLIVVCLFFSKELHIVNAIKVEMKLQNPTFKLLSIFLL